ncbi:MAG: hypothetical protein ACQEUT_18070 [Bacillota bacterium]
MMKKKLGLIAGGMLAIGLMTGCVAPLENIYFEGKQYDELRLEELIEDRLEQENGLDLEVNIYEEADE